jgi:hypothetical protein
MPAAVSEPDELRDPDDMRGLVARRDPDRMRDPEGAATVPADADGACTPSDLGRREGTAANVSLPREPGAAERRGMASWRVAVAPPACRPLRNPSRNTGAVFCVTNVRPSVDAMRRPSSANARTWRRSPKRDRCTTVQPRHGLWKRCERCDQKANTGRLSNPSGHQLTYPGATPQCTQAAPQCRPGIQNHAPADVTPHRP